MDKNLFLVLRHLYLNGSNSSIRNISNSTSLSIGSVHSSKNKLISTGYIDINSNILPKGKEELEKYKVNSAIIMAAGLSTRLVPLSFEKPKGLFEVRGEILIERQIKQLKEAGIENIYLVLGYKKQSFFYLGDKYGVKIIINPHFETKENSESIFLAKEYISNSYILSSDNYYINNPFSKYEYDPYIAVEEIKKKKEGYYLLTGPKDKIIGRQKGKYNGYLYKGMMYWDSSFSKEIISLLENHRNYDDFSQDSIYSVIFNHLHILPSIYIKRYEEDTIFKFYNLDELRKFDEKYIENTSSKIMRNIATTLKCKESEIQNFLPIKEGLTNTSYTFEVKGNKYVYRHPGEGTEKIIDRRNEYESLKLAKELGIDPTFIKMDPKEGWKISSYFSNSREPDYYDFNDSKLIINKMKELHDKKGKVSYSFEPWLDALKMEKIVRKKVGIDMPDFNELKNDIKDIYNLVDNDNLVEKCFCHCDTYKPNWLIKKEDNSVILIDWEYAGMTDPAVDVAYYIVDAMYEDDDAIRFIKEYIGNDNKELLKHFYAYIPIVAYYWFVWALFRESCSAVMGESLYNWYYMAKKYVRLFKEKYY